MKFASVFTDHAVFQREIAIPVWGTEAVPQHLLQIELAGAKTFTRAAENGDFFFRLPPLPAGGPYELTVRDTEDGTTLSLQDILIGEVWLAGGQSNMEYLLGSDWSATKDLPEEKRANEVNYKQKHEYLETMREDGMIRSYSVPRIKPGSRESNANASWVIVDKKTAPEVSAVALWFARNLQEKLNVPVGLLVSDWGGTITEAWTSRAGLLSNPVTAGLPQYTDAGMQLVSNWEGKELDYKDFAKPDPGNAGFGMGWASAEFNDVYWNNFQVPGSWIAQRIAGNGSVWARRKVQIPKSWAGKPLILKLGGIDKMDTTYFNGVEVGKTGSGWDVDDWNKKRTYPVPAELVKAGEAVVAVRGYSFFFDGSMNGREEDYLLCLDDTDETISLAGIWKAQPEMDFGILTMPTEWSAGNANSPSILFDAMIRPLLPYAIRGAIWYQGESNAGLPNVSQLYRSKLDTMIRDWRYHWEEGDFPFLQVQLANYRAAVSFDAQSSWAPLREAQFLCCKDLPNVYMATAVDIGDTYDIHPQNKKDVGYRLALSAFHHVYGMSDVVPFGPLYTGYNLEGSRIRIRFDYAKGLHFQGEPKGFYLADFNEKFVPADKIEIDGESIVVSASGIKMPLYVRYSWSDNPDGNLCNGAELPASPFRTDSLPL